MKADFRRVHAGGTEVHGVLSMPADRFSIAVLYGPSGCGKTTVLRCMAGLEAPREGSICFGSETWFDAIRGIHLPPQRRRIGYLFQEAALFPHMTVRQNMAYALGSGDRGRVAELTKLFELEGLENRRPAELSGGQNQRVALARAIAHRPRLVLLDEPLAGLDAPLREELRVRLRRWLAETGVPVVLVTHDRTEAIALADQVVVMSGGQVLQTGSMRDVFNHPVSRAVAGIVGMETVEPARVVEVREGMATLAVADRTLLAIAPKRIGSTAIMCIRAEEVLLARGDVVGMSARNRLIGRVHAIRDDGTLLRVTVDCGFELTALITRSAREDLGLHEGDTITALVKASAIHLIEG